ncbi:MAG: dipeptide ABC transporter ATP-binding protein [Verrucomicrobiota bacterium]
MSEVLLELQNVKTHFPLWKGMLIRKSAGVVKAVDGINLQLKKGEILGLVGESGCGKSTLARTILQLIPPTEGHVYLNGQDLSGLSSEELRKSRVDFQMIFQDPYASLNPRMTVFDTLAEPIVTHVRLSSSELVARITKLMERVGLNPKAMRKYPHEFSGDQRQRIAIARALALEPKLVLADEPVSALDVSIQAQILNLLSDLCVDMGLTMIFISHDLSVVKHISDRIAVMYLGRIVEMGEAAEIFDHPQHPYTRALISAVPMADPDKERSRERVVLEGDPPSPINPPPACTFHTRCPIAQDICRQDTPEFRELQPNHFGACHFPGGERG